MAHDHSHDTDTYYLDQLCMIGITGAFAGICLTLYYFNTAMLDVLLQAEFHVYILAVGIALAFIVVVRAAVLWKETGKTPGAHGHDHAHDHCCGHDHDHGPDLEQSEHHHHHDHACGHDHAHQHEHAEHHDHAHGDHDHVHEHAHAVAQVLPSPGATALAMAPAGHSHDDHDHSWAPWRYVVLLVPLMLYLLGLPTKAVPLGTAGVVDVTSEARQVTQLLTLGNTPLQQAAYAAAMMLNVDDRVAPIYVDNDQKSIANLQRGMKVWIKLVPDDKVVGNKGAAGVWATKGAGVPPSSAASPWTAMGVVKAVNAKENTLTVAESVDSQSDQTFDLEGTVFIEYKALEQLAGDPRWMREYDKKKVQVVGQFVPYRTGSTTNANVFSLSRLRIQCCGADAIQLNVPIICRESVQGFKVEDWVRVTGRIEFREQPNRPGIYKTVLLVNRRDNVVKTNPDPKPYIN